jgi:tetratricopeptide (TPR) repeat protein
MKNAGISLSLVLALLMGYTVTLGQSASKRKQVPAKARTANQQNTEFDQAVKAGDEARTAGRFGDALQAYEKALSIRPTWPDGWWYVGAIFYQTDNYAKARDAFRNLVALEPKRGAAWGMLGLCEFQTREYEPAVISLQRGRSLGFDGNKEIESVVRYHAALLYIRFEQFEIGYEILREFLRIGQESPKIVEAFGLTILRLPFLPNEVPPDKRELVLLAGEAGRSMAARRLEEARKSFETLVSRYPNEPNVHYSFGVFQLSNDADTALKEFQRTLELSPLHQPAMVQMAFEYLKRDQHNEALPLAERAVQLAPKMYPARNVLGRVLLELGQINRAVTELEEGVRLAPNIPEMHFALARAYTRAGRKADADREREIFKKLQQEYSEKENPGQTGGASSPNPEKPNPE